MLGIQTRRSPLRLRQATVTINMRARIQTRILTKSLAKSLQHDPFVDCVKHADVRLLLEFDFSYFEFRETYTEFPFYWLSLIHWM